MFPPARPDLLNILPLKLDVVVIPVKSLSIDRRPVLPTPMGLPPFGA